MLGYSTIENLTAEDYRNEAAQSKFFCMLPSQGIVSETRTGKSVVINFTV